jgi:hypothetical protein
MYMLDLKELRTRLRNMTDNELEGYGVVAKIMCSQTLNSDQPPRECFITQLREARAEWARREYLSPDSF